MDSQQVCRRLHNRGYTWRIKYPPDLQLTVDSWDGGHQWNLADIERAPESYFDVMLSELANGQEHVRHMCGYPLLREFKNAGNHETLAYRAVKEGPTSKRLLECPCCWQYVQDDSVEEINDV